MCILYSQQEFHASQPQHPPYQSIQPLHHLRPIPENRDSHTTPPSDDENWQVLPSDVNNSSDANKLLPLTSSRSSSLASLPPGASPPIANPPISTPRTASPFPGANSIRSSHPKEPREREKERRGSPAAISILNALNPQFTPPANLDAPRPNRDDEALVFTQSDGSIREEKKERGGFWSWASSGERDSHRRDIRERDDGQQDLMRMIGISPRTYFHAVFLINCARLLDSYLV
jgi:hypothetical protein